MDVVEKSASATVAPVESDDPNGSFSVVLSTEALDRDDENLWADEWKQPLPARIHIDGDHGRNLEKTVGSAVPRLDGDRMVADGTFASTPYAQMVRQLVNEGHINSLSVTYAESKNQKDNGVQRELLNAAFVAIPANPEAVVLSSKSAKTGDDKAAKVGTMDSMTLMELVAKAAGGKVEERPKHDAMVQAIHDAANHLGAQCAPIDYQPDSGSKQMKAAGGLSASGNNPDVPPSHDDMMQAVHDAAGHLGAQCQNEIEADPGTADGANKSADEETSSTKSVGTPQETEESTAATADKAAAAAEEPAHNAALTKAKELEKARGLAYLISKNTKEQ